MTFIVKNIPSKLCIEPEKQYYPKEYFPMKPNLSGPGSYHILEELEKECALIYLQPSYNEGEKIFLVY